MADPCIFCAIVAGDLPSTRVDEDERTISFMDVNPGTEGHVLVIPRAHSRDLLDIGPEDLAACALTSQRIAARVTARLGADGVNLINCCGEAAWQTVFHFHLHVVPRYRDDPARDPLQLPWVPTPGDPASIARAGALLQG